MVWACRFSLCTPVFFRSTNNMLDCLLAQAALENVIFDRTGINNSYAQFAVTTFLIKEFLGSFSNWFVEKDLLSPQGLVCAKYPQCWAIFDGWKDLVASCFLKLAPRLTLGVVSFGWDRDLSTCSCCHLVTKGSLPV